MFAKSTMFYFAVICVLLTGCFPESEEAPSPLIGSWPYLNGVMTFNEDGTYSYVPSSGESKSENGEWFDDGVSVTMEQYFDMQESGTGSLNTTMTYAVVDNQFHMGDVYHAFTASESGEKNNKKWKATIAIISDETNGQNSYISSWVVNSIVEIADNELTWTNEIVEVSIENGQEKERSTGTAIASGTIRMEGNTIYFKCAHLESNNFKDIGMEFCDSENERLFGNLLTPDILNALNYQYLYL